MPGIEGLIVRFLYPPNLWNERIQGDFENDKQRNSSSEPDAKREIALVVAILQIICGLAPLNLRQHRVQIGGFARKVCVGVVLLFPVGWRLDPFIRLNYSPLDWILDASLICLIHLSYAAPRPGKCWRNRS